MASAGAKRGRTANASPTKQFFVDMLVRDIELKDTILDLLDNCVDGILRSVNPDLKKRTPYRGYRADIVVSGDQFIIEDNCGGIPIKIAEKSAFAIGKPDPIKGADAIATVGMYGIGMKRAIFKIGTDATVDSWNDDAFRVRITPSWLRAEDWKRLPMLRLPPGVLTKGRTRIVIERLNPAVKAEFESEYFARDLREEIARNYALIMDKGFAVTVRTSSDQPVPDAIDPNEFKLLRKRGLAEDQDGIAPYLYVGELDGVQIEIYAGLYRELPSEEEREREEETRGSTDDAGWTVACNDRVIVWKDRTRLTGWGEGSVPNYHGQFIAITGLVLLKSANPELLPLTTTKRGIDGTSSLYSKVKDLMKEATKGLTTFTNKWKKFEEGLEALYQGSEYISLADLRASLKRAPMRATHKFSTVRRFAPKLPVPAAEKTKSRVSFVALKSHLSTLAIAYFDDVAVKPAEVGEEAFRREVALYQEAAE